MANITLSVPEDLYRIIKMHNEVRWSEVARRAMWDYAMRLEMLNKITKKSKLTDKDVMELDKKIKSGLAKHYRKYVK